MNIEKTEYLKIGDEAEDAELKLHEVKRCNEFKYLGTIISEEGTTKRDLHNRTQQAKRAVRTLNSLLWSNKIRIKTKMTIDIAIVEPILTYGSECWQFSKEDKKKIETVEMDYLRRMRYTL